MFNDRAPLDCGNWLTHLHDYWPTTKFVQVYPRWKNPAEDGTPVREQLEVHSWRNWDGLNRAGVVRSVFLCRSGVWTPPHLDVDFMELARTLARVQPTIINRIIKRDAPTVEEAAELRRKYAENMTRLRELVEK
jgi:hypothetical protein